MVPTTSGKFTGRPRKSAVPGLAVKVLEVLEVAPAWKPSTPNRIGF
jgi:hypothetical protein